MSDPQLFRLRVSYVKKHPLVYLSHLEIARALERMIRRAGLPFAVTQGFNPHMKMSLGSALAVGVGSDHEIYDVMLVDYVAPDKALSALQKASPHGLMPFAAEYVAAGAPAPDGAYPISEYICELDPVPLEFIPADEVSVVRKGRTKTLVVADYLMESSLNADGKVVLRLCSSPQGSLRPDILVKASLDKMGLTQTRIVSLTRSRLLTQ